MRIALIHSFYTSRRPSGENVMVNLQAGALAKAGYGVKLIARYTDELRERNPFYPLKAGIDVSTGLGYDPTAELLDFNPDVVWVHNLFPNFSTKWLAKWQGPLIATLYNYRPVCANGVLFRAGAVCTLCPDGKPLSALKYGCYKGSRIASVPLTIQTSKGLDANPLIARADKLVVLSSRSHQIFVKFGIGANRLFLLPTFTPGPDYGSISWHDNGKWIFAGRLGVEKGISQLLEIWPDSVQLDIFGDGPELDKVKRFVSPCIHVYPSQPVQILRRMLPDYVGLIFPSMWPETQGGVVSEAFQAGLPVVARAGSAGADWVAATGAGILYEQDSRSLNSALSAVSTQRTIFSIEARRAFHKYFSEEQWLRGCENLMGAAAKRREVM